MSTITELPLLTEMADEAWGADLPATLRQLFSRPDAGLFQSIDGSLLAYRNADLKALAANPAVGNLPAPLLAAAFNAVGADGESRFQRLVGNHVFTANPPLHGPLRKVFARQFMPRNVARLAPLAESTVESVLGELAGQIDFVGDFAHRLTARFWGRLIGLTLAEQDRIARMSAEIAPAFLLMRSDEQTADVESAAGEYLDLVSRAITRTLETEHNELLAEMAADLDAVSVSGRPENLGLMLGAILMDGFHTLSVGVANIVYSLLSEPAALDAVRRDRSLVTKAFYEGVRLAPPTTFTQRYALDDFTYAGVVVPRGTVITMLWLAGNRDPEVFADPDDYRLDRPIGRDTTFGGGIHLCPGRNVAKLLAEHVLTALTAPDVEISLAGGDLPWVTGSTMHQLETMPVTIRRTENRPCH